MNEQSESRREKRELPAHLLAEAARNPGGSVAEIDASLIGDPDGYIPAEAIRGVYLVGPDGRPTGEFVHNSGYGTVRDDFSRLESSDHWLGWLPGGPAAAVRGSIAEIIAEQVPGAMVEWIKVVENPAFLTSGRRMPGDADRLVVTRAGLAVSFALAAIPPRGRRELLTGVFSWVASGLDTLESRQDRVWFDLGMTAEQGEDLLRQRIYEL